MSNKIKKFKVHDPVFCSTLNVIHNTPNDVVVRYIARTYDGANVNIESPGKYFCLYKEGEAKRYFIYVKEFSWRIEEQSLLDHEILHFVFASLKDAGITFSNDSEEAYTYYFSFIKGEVYRKLMYLHTDIKQKPTS